MMHDFQAFYRPMDMLAWPDHVRPLKENLRVFLNIGYELSFQAITVLSSLRR
jgi:hypothetical protein